MEENPGQSSAIKEEQYEKFIRRRIDKVYRRHHPGGTAGILTIEDSFITYTSTNSSNYSDYDSRIIHNTGTLNSYNNEYNVTNNSQYKNKHLVGLYNAGLMTSNSDIINVY